MRPSNDPKADELRNSNLSQSTDDRIAQLTEKLNQEEEEEVQNGSEV